MKTDTHYIMREQVQDLIPSLMEQDVTIKFQQEDSRLHLISIGLVTLAYLISMALSGY
ncbi:MAG: hypothetical protein ABW166_08570 [Sedimenticola sp.]